ncbi:hypothetical protein PoB_000977500 [Plakobranchus ocellatus]|uniref:Uncharacterized protein n=1 Tax=Plakobranchus ocellatus TaxID=259542 RepID=A0AAV3YJK6_9GAST|nr:hypothetical protein PoB_000977500 [Plakobranchus ocellatus]
MMRSERVYSIYRKLKILCQGVKNSFLDYIDSHHVLITLNSNTRKDRLRRSAHACLLATLAIFSSETRHLGDSEIQWVSLVYAEAKKAPESVYMGSYQNCVMVQGAVQAAFVTMINKFVGNLVDLEAQDQAAVRSFPIIIFFIFTQYRE